MAYFISSSKIVSTNYKCGYCGKDISSNHGYNIFRNSSDSSLIGVIAICHNCEKPTYFQYYPNLQIPSPEEGRNIQKLPENIEQIYKEIKNCYSVQAWTSVVLLSRKLLMHIAVEHGALEDKKFIEYVDFIKKEHLVPKGCAEWLEKIRGRGNSVNHTITLSDIDEAKEIFEFIQIFLQVNYEFNYLLK